MNALNSVHTKNGVSCISCHSPHHAVDRANPCWSSLNPSFAITCHLQQKAQFAMPFHHRVEEGLIQCSDCHNVHGSALPKQVRVSSTQDAVCFKCHTDKQGPFVYEHAAVKVERLPILPLGSRRAESSHAEAEQRQSALPAVPHHVELQQRARELLRSTTRRRFFQACTLCHEAIHGSNFSSFYFK